MERNQSLDALRGIAILGMVFSGSITYADVLPHWMYHAQVPPPNHQFIPTLAGITWVDLVFPFFLFSMGAAIPLALSKNVQNNSSFLQVLFIAFRRLALLAFFALFTQHMKPWVLSGQPTTTDYLLAIGAFGLLFLQLYNYKEGRYKKVVVAVKIAAFVIAVLLLYGLSFNGKSFQFYNSDIIIIVLANMAFFGTIIWWLTKNNPLMRVGILPFIMAIFLAANEPTDGWAKALYNWSHIEYVKFDWLYRFYFLKYLFIIIPGTFAGDWFKEYKTTEVVSSNKKTLLPIGLLAFALLVSTNVFLFIRQLGLNLFVTISLLAVMYYLFKKMAVGTTKLLFQFFKAGAYLLLLGLFFEAYEGGIKKDHSTYSYYFVTSGLAFFMLLFFSCIALSKKGKVVNNYLSLNGRNPMVAYVAGVLLITPLLHITGAIVLFEMMNANAFLGVLKGVLFTGLVSLVTILFTKKGWFWTT